MGLDSLKMTAKTEVRMEETLTSLVKNWKRALEKIGIGKAVDSRSFSMSYYGEKPTKGVEQVFSSKEKKNNKLWKKKVF